MRISSLWLFFLLVVSHVNGQINTPKDTTSIISYVDKIILKTNLDTKSESYSLYQNNNNKFSLITNNAYRLTLSLDYEFIGFSFGYSPKFLPENNDDKLKGESSYNEYKFRFFIKKWTQEIGYSKVQGFYVNNTSDFIPDWMEGQDPYIQFPSIKVTTWEGSTSYVFNDNFSLRNVAYNTEWQIRSAGSFIPTLHYNYTRISAIIDSSKIYDNTLEFRFSPEYYYTFVIHKNWFITPIISPSIGIRFSKEKGINTVENNIYWPIGFSGGLQLGYSSRKIIFGLNINFEETIYNEDSQNSVINDKVFAKLYLGYRFKPPKFIKKPFEWVNKQIDN